jgi:hypothetical protein
VNQSFDSFKRKILGYGMGNAMKLLIKSAVFAESNFVGASRAW